MSALDPEQRAAELLALAERVEEASGADREIECTIAKAIGWLPPKGSSGAYTSSPWAWCPNWSSSLDAVVALIAERLPGKSWTVNSSGFGGSWARLHDPMRQPGFGADYPRADAATPALALLAAALRALASEGDRS